MKPAAMASILPQNEDTVSRHSTLCALARRRDSASIAKLGAMTSDAERNVMVLIAEQGGLASGIDRYGAMSATRRRVLAFARRRVASIAEQGGLA